MTRTCDGGRERPTVPPPLRAERVRRSRRSATRQIKAVLTPVASEPLARIARVAQRAALGIGGIRAAAVSTDP